MEKLIAYIQLTRPINLLITFFSVFTSAYLCVKFEFDFIIVFIAATAASLINAAGNVLNDYLDIEIDKINRPNRILISHELSKNFVLMFYYTLNFLALTLTFFVNFNTFLIASLTIIILVLYNFKFKSVPLLGNIVVAFLTGLVFIYGGYAVGNPGPSVIVALFAFLINLMREIIKDLEDVEGDKQSGILTFVNKFGTHYTFYLLILIFAALNILSIYVFFARIYKIEFFIIVMNGINFLLIYSLKTISWKATKQQLNKASKMLKVSMILGIIAIIVGT